MPHDIELIPLAAPYAAVGYERAIASNMAHLQASGATRFVTAVRLMTMHATVMATGTISVFEGLLQQTLGGSKHASDDIYGRMATLIWQNGSAIIGWRQTF